jgi:OHCU decarboxylase
MSSPYSFESPLETERIGSRLNALNACALETAYHQFKRCCGSSKWADQMARTRPFSSIMELEQAADRIWTASSREDWLEAFAAHPRIGQHSQNRWSQEEQSGAVIESSEIRSALAEANQKYEVRFGHIFILCATGKTALEILAILQQRLRNDPATEIQIAAEQQRLITRLRLIKLLSE